MGRDSSKEKPTLGGQRIKTRKRNIAAPLDPAAFADAVVQIYLDNAGDLVVFTGGRTQPGTTKPDEGERHPYSILECEAKRELILPSVIYIQKILRRKPFLIKNLENVMRRFLQSLEFLKKMKELSWQFSQHLPFPKSYLEYLIDNSLDDLISILKRGKMEDNLLDFFPSGKRSAEAFSEHFTKGMKSALTTQISEDADISEVIETVKQHVKDAKLPEIEVVRILWDVLMDACSMVKTWAKLLNTFCTNGKLELELLYKVKFNVMKIQS
ncbi:hypothetical protein E3N88_13306 [Mikania micrantha]|uniref:5MP1/2-like HEAT domain-containing protein n=1 Tax=Mikania micrantha TaxID=192012 RepID=A0A5N6PAI6_9ASTR|nr:hypothetical protein E3N88_13306 [Mikania micrantha]